jgi:hypothetical protein
MGEKIDIKKLVKKILNEDEGNIIYPESGGNSLNWTDRENLVKFAKKHQNKDIDPNDDSQLNQVILDYIWGDVVKNPPNERQWVVILSALGYMYGKYGKGGDHMIQTIRGVMKGTTSPMGWGPKR